MNFYEFAKDEIKAALLVNTEYINGRAADAIDPYLHLQRFTPVYSDSAEWETFSTLGTRVLADIISLDSPHPIKKRASIAQTKGKIEKIATKRTMNETEQMKLREWMMSSNDRLKQRAITMITDDAMACQSGIHETWEAMVYQALSNEGVAIFAPLTDPANVTAGAKDNVGLGVRIDFGFENTLNITIPWSDRTNSTPIDDITRVLDLARQKGIRIVEANTNRATFNNLVANTQVKSQYASSIGFAGTITGSLTLDQLNTFFLSQYGFVWAIREHNFIAERDGVQTAVDMWNDGAIAFVSSNSNWGDLCWTECVEMYEPASGYNYERPEDPILIGLYREKLNSTSWMKITEGQSIAMPVLNPMGIITLDTLNPAV